MTRSEPSQADILGERFRHVPWRRVMRDAMRERLGNGPTVLPDRLEGGVYGYLAGDLACSPAASSARRSSMLDMLELLLARQAGWGGDASGGPGIGSVDTGVADPHAGVLPVPLVLRSQDVPTLVGLAASASDDGSAHRGRHLAGALNVLILRRLLAGERDPSGVLRRATGDLHGVIAACGLPGSPQLSQPAVAIAALDAVLHRAPAAGRDPAVDGFWSGWDAFARTRCYEQAVTHARAAADGTSSAPAVAGGLAGVRWGSGAIPAVWRRALPEGPRARALVDRLIETTPSSWDGRPWRTSTSDPLRVHALDLSGLDGRPTGSVGITVLPGRRYVGYHTGAHWRDLDTDVARLRELGIDVLLLLVEDAELVRCRVTGIGEALAAQGVELFRFPIRDPRLPRDGPAFQSTIASLWQRVRQGVSVAIACRGGLDRAGMASGCLLREAGLPADESISRVHRARRGALTLPDQQAYVRAWRPGR